MKKFYLYVFTHGEMKLFGRFDIDSERYVHHPDGDKIPLEDYGDYVISDTKMTPEAAWEYWYELA